MRINTSLIAVVLAVSLVGFGLAGCSKKVPENTEVVVAPAEGLGPEESLETVESQVLEGRTSGPMLPIYFDYDQSTIQGENKQRLETNAEFLSLNPSVVIRIEGNCDPRGTREYNLALGERRAQSAKMYLMNLGIAGDRLDTISWGEEKLFTFGQDEDAWAQNRRDDFVIIP